MAYAILASSPPITGIYTAVFPLIIYIMMGTSRHASLGKKGLLQIRQRCFRLTSSYFLFSGTFAVISLMVSKAISENTSVPVLGSSSSMNSSTPTNIPIAMALSSKHSMPSDLPMIATNEVYSAQEVVATLGFLVEIFQVSYMQENK